MDFLRQLFGSGDFQPHGYCYLWDSGLVWLNVLSDALIALAYFTIPITLLVFIRKRRDLPFSWIFALFGVFIVACGLTHVMEVWNLWHAQYWLAGVIKAITAAASLVTAVLLMRLVPKALGLPNVLQWARANAALEKEVHERRELELDLRISESRYRENAELLDLTHDAIFVRNLRNEIVFWNRGAERLYGWQREEVRGKVSHILTQTIFPQPLAEIEAQVLEKGYWEGELEHRRRDGSKVIVSSRWVLRTDVGGHPSAIMESNSDITARKAEQEKFRNLLEAAPDAMVIVNRAGEIQLVNTQTEKLFGYAREEILGKQVEILVPKRFHGRHESHRTGYTQSPSHRAMGAGQELFGLRKDGGEFAVEISLSPIETDEGTLTMSAIRDVTDRKQTEEALHRSEEKLRLLLEGVKDYAILMLDPGGRVSTWNETAERIKGYRAEEIIGHHFSKFYPAEDVASGKPSRELKVATEKGRYEEEGWRARKDGSLFWASVVITALRDKTGRLRGFGKVTRDITERKQAEDQLEHHRQELSRSNSELVAANKELESFCYSVSHDLRAPLRAIDGFSHALLEDCAGNLDDTGTNYLNRIRAATQRMGVLIDDLLNLSRLSRAEMRKQNLDISVLARSIASSLQKAQPGRQVEFRIEDGLKTIADPGLLRVMLENLLSNAWKFTSKLPRAHIEFGITRGERGPAFFVRDDGAGFDPAYADRLFGAFQRLHSTSEFEGTGVGLATVQRIIHRHGGRIWAESAINRGATFYFTLDQTVSQGELHEKQSDLVGRR